MLSFCSGDVVLEIDGKPINSVKEIFDSMGLDVGRTLEMKVRRNSGAEATIYVTTVESASR